MNKYIKLPCDIGDTVYTLIDSVDVTYIQEDEVIAFEMWNVDGETKLFIRTKYGIYVFDTKVSLSMKEANAKLKALLRKIEMKKKYGGN